MFEKVTTHRNKTIRQIEHNFQMGKINSSERNSKFGLEFYRTIEYDLNSLSDEFTENNLPTTLDFYFEFLFKEIIKQFKYPEFTSLMKSTINNLEENKMRTVKLHTKTFKDREAILLGLANSGYKVWVEEKKVGVMDIDIYVCFEIDNKDIK